MTCCFEAACHDPIHVSQEGSPSVSNQQKSRDLASEVRPVSPQSNRSRSAAPYDDKQAKLEYLVQLIRELRMLSASIDEQTLTYLLEMAVLEADQALRVHAFGAELGKG